MKVVADANILFAALLKESMTRRLWFHPALDLVAPDFIAKEFIKYKKELLAKYAGSEKDFNELLARLLHNLRLVSDTQLKPFLPGAATFSSDSGDWLYLACALLENAIIWSNDKNLKKQARIKVKTTQELAKEVGLP